MTSRLIFLDRDGVLNKLVVDAEQGTIDSPLHPSQVAVYPTAARAALKLCDAGYALAIVTNQPSAAKGKTTRENLEATHRKIVAEVEASGARIASSHICFHRGEDQCACRKPKTGLLEEALKKQGATKEGAWMVGDGIGDVKAGMSFGVKTAFLGPKKVEYMKVFAEYGVQPDLWCEDLMEFAEKISGEKK